MDPNLPRWIKSSLADHFSTVTDTIDGLNYFVEGIDEPEIGDFQADSALFKMDGPIINQGSGNTEWYRIDILILLTDIVHRREAAYSIQQWGGVYAASMLNDVLSIYKYGNGPGDDDSLIGCLEPDPTVRNNIRIVNYGQIDKDSRIKQLSVIGRFVLYC